MEVCKVSLPGRAWRAVNFNPERVPCQSYGSGGGTRHPFVVTTDNAEYVACKLARVLRHGTSRDGQDDILQALINVSRSMARILNKETV